MADLIPVIAALAIPFMLGIAVGVEIVKRRPKGVNERLGDAIADRVKSLTTTRRFVGIGAEISNVTSIKLEDGRTVELIVREAA